MQESMSSSRSTAFYGNNYDEYCNYQYHHHQQQQPPPVPAPPAAATATASDDFEDADSGWTTYFLQLDSDEEEDASVAVSKNREKQQLWDVGAVVPCGSRSIRGSASTVSSKPNEDKDNNKQAVKKKKALMMKGLKKSRIVEEEEEEDSLQDTASSPLLLQVININGHLSAGSLEHYCRHDEHHNSQVVAETGHQCNVEEVVETSTSMAGLRGHLSDP